MLQKTPKPKASLLPSFVSIISTPDVKHSNPIKKTVSAIKNVWTVTICLFIRLSGFSSTFQLKYLGNMI